MTLPVLLALLASAEQFYKTGVDLFQAGRLLEAVAPLQEAARLEPRNARYWLALGVVHAARQDYAAADEPFAAACRLEPRLPDACYYYGRNLYALNRFEPSIEALRKALPMDGRPWRVHTGIGQAQEALARAADAQSSFERAVRLFEASPASEQAKGEETPHLPYGVFLFRQGRFSEARNLLERAAADRPRSARAQFELGRLLYQLGELDKALGPLSAAVSLGHGAAAHLLLGKTYLRLGRTAEAQPHLAAGNATSEATAR